MICEKCKKGVGMDMMTDGECEICGSYILGSQSPCEKICETCSNAHNKCEMCGNSLSS